MAATVNLPVAAILPSAPEKAAVEPATSSSEGKGAFSRALNEQMDKKQSTAAAEPKQRNTPQDKPAANQAKLAVHKEKQSVSDDKPATGAAGNASEPDQAPTKVVMDDAQAEPGAVDEAAAASMQTPAMQQLSLREMMSLGIAAGEQGETDGKLLPQVANVDQSPTAKLAELMKLAGFSQGVQQGAIDPESGAKSGEAAIPPGLALLQQRIQQQLAAQNQAAANAEQTDSPDDIVQLRGLEQALQALTKASEQGDSKGIEIAREQIMNRLQLLQSASEGRDPARGLNLLSQGDGKSNDLRALLQGLVADHGLKMTRVAFQEMIAKSDAQLPGQNLPSASAANPAALLQGSLGALANSNNSSSNAMQFSLPSSYVNVPVNSDAWGRAIGERLQWMVKQDMQGAEIKLNPRHLGPIEVKIAMNQDQATVSFAAHHTVTRDALESAVPRLREMFGDSGLNLIDVNVSHNSDPRGQQAFSGNGEGDQAHRGGGMWSSSDPAVDESMLTEPRTQHWITSNRMLDTYV